MTHPTAFLRPGGVVAALLVAGFVVGSGCAAETEPTSTDPPEEARGRLGKADLIGDCSAETCGGKSDGQCWCDELCVQYGDCCHNVQQICELGGNECVENDDCSDGFCGWADDHTTRICKPWGQIGESCEGFVVPSARNFCDPSLTCVFPEETHDVPGTCQPSSCDPTLICTQALTCVNGQTYPTGCGPANCDEPLGPCQPDPPPPPPAPTCEGMCGGPAIDKACYCDDACSYFGDCCDDYEDFCQ